MKNRTFNFAPPEAVHSTGGKTYDNRSVRFAGVSRDAKALFSEHDRVEIDLRSPTVSIDGGIVTVETPALDAGNRDVRAEYVFYMVVGDSLESLKANEGSVRGYIVYIPEQAGAFQWDDRQGKAFLAKDVYVFKREDVR